jgi:hypothetical protein
MADTDDQGGVWERRIREDPGSIDLGGYARGEGEAIHRFQVCVSIPVPRLGPGLTA